MDKIDIWDYLQEGDDMIIYYDDGSSLEWTIETKTSDEITVLNTLFRIRYSKQELFRLDFEKVTAHQGCPHEPVDVPLLTSILKVCRLCDEELS